MRISFIVSLSIHIILIGLLVYLFLPKQANKIGNEKVVSVYLTQLPATIKNFASNHHANSQHTIVLHPAKNGLSHTNPHNVKNSSLSINKVGKYNKLLLLLHNKVQQQINQQSYLLPDFLKGRSTQLSFNLTPEGKISEVVIEKSSGAESLDQLALESITAIRLPEAQQFIKTTKRFSIKIVFN